MAEIQNRQLDDLLTRTGRAIGGEAQLHAASVVRSVDLGFRDTSTGTGRG